MNNLLVSIIIPTKNSGHLLRDLLDSVAAQDYPSIEVIINDDDRTNDDTASIVRKYQLQSLAVELIKENRSMAQGRKAGAAYAKGGIYLHLDSDMKLTPNLVQECVTLMKEYDALVIPEESFGTTFWAKCKWLERKCYEEVEELQSLRCISREVYQKVEGHDERLVFSEDKDLDIRVREAGYKVTKTKNYLYHNEGNLKLLNTLKKKLFYSDTADLFAKKNPEAFRWQANPIHRYIIFMKNAHYLLKYPTIYVGMVFMKTCEYLFAGLGYLTKKQT